MISIFLETQCTSMTFTSCKKSVGIFTHFSRADATNRYRVFMNICCFFTKYSSEPRAVNDSFYYNISYRVFHTKKYCSKKKEKITVCYLAISRNAKLNTIMWQAYRWHGDSNHIRKRTGMDEQAAGRRISLHTLTHTPFLTLTHTHPSHTHRGDTNCQHSPRNNQSSGPRRSSQTTVVQCALAQLQHGLRKLYSVRWRSCIVCGSCTECSSAAVAWFVSAVQCALAQLYSMVSDSCIEGTVHAHCAAVAWFGQLQSVHFSAAVYMQLLYSLCRAGRKILSCMSELLWLLECLTTSHLEWRISPPLE